MSLRCLLLLCLCAALANAAQVAKLRNEGNTLLVDVMLGTRTLVFMVDTGSRHTLLERETLAGEMPPGSRSGTIVASSGARLRVDWVNVDLKLPGVPMVAFGETGLVDLSPLRYATGLDIRGVLGLDLLENALLYLEPSRKRYELVLGGKPRPYPGSKSVPLQVTDFGLVAALASEAIQFETVIDTGFDASLVLGSSQFDEAFSRREKEVSSAPLASAVSAEITESGLLPWISFGNSLPRINKVAVQKGGAISLLGLGLLARFDVLIDFKQRNLWLAPRKKAAADLDPRDESGISFARVDGATIIPFVRPGGVAQRVGLRSGDVLISLDGSDPNVIPLHQLRERLRPSFAWRNVNLVVLRNGVRATFKTKPATSEAQPRDQNPDPHARP